MNIKELHDKAMELAALADMQKMQENKEYAMSLYEESYSLEYEAAMNAFNAQIGEPSVSVLLRSAATLAITCKRVREAEILIALALSGEPPWEIGEELRKIRDNLNLYRRFEVKSAVFSEMTREAVVI